MQEAARTGDFAQTRGKMYRNKIKISYDENRAIFTADYHRKNTSFDVFARECNGLILEMNTWKPLMVPPRGLRANIDTVTGNKFVQQHLYDIYRAEDGTCFNMYYYGENWVISTARGYAMNDVSWGGKTYQQLVEECLAHVNLTWDQFTEQLVTTRCYSFGFKHKDFHKFQEGQSTPINRMWFIQSVDLDEQSDRYLWSSNASPCVEIPNQKVYTTTITNLKELYTLAARAYDAFCNSGDVCYGFILRSKDHNITGNSSDLFIESSLMSTIRKLWYDNTIVSACRANQWDKDIAVTLNAYLSDRWHEKFNVLFPQEAQRFASFTAGLQQIAACMCNSADQSDIDDRVTTVARVLLQKFTAHVSYDTSGKSDEERQKIYYQYCVHPAHFDVLLQLFNGAQWELSAQRGMPSITWCLFIVNFFAY